MSWSRHKSQKGHWTYDPPGRRGDRKFLGPHTANIPKAKWEGRESKPPSPEPPAPDPKGGPPLCPDCGGRAHARYFRKRPVFSCYDECGWWHSVVPGSAMAFAHAKQYRSNANRSHVLSQINSTNRTLARLGRHRS